MTDAAPPARVRAPIAGLAAGEMLLDSATAHYLLRVRRLRPGDAFVGFDPKTGHEADVRIVREERTGLVVLVNALRAKTSERFPHVTLVQSLAKGEKCDAIIRDATELMVADIVLVRTARTVVQLDDERGRKKIERYMRIAEQAARQCGRTQIPSVSGPMDFNEGLTHIHEHKDAGRFLLYEAAHTPLAPELFLALSQRVPLAFAVGPEGGFTESEVIGAERLGWKVVSLGPSTLRTETVAASVLGAVCVWAHGDGARIE